jgi:hypothetical protein
MKVTKKQLRQIIKENLLLELNVAWFAARKGGALISFLTAFLGNKPDLMKKAAIDIADYYDGDCDEMLADVNQVSNSSGMMKALMNVGIPMIKQFDLKDKTVDPQLIKVIMSEEVIGCNDEVIDAIIKLAFKFADQLLSDHEEFKEYQLAKDLPKFKKIYNIS